MLGSTFLNFLQILHDLLLCKHVNFQSYDRHNFSWPVRAKWADSATWEKHHSPYKIPSRSRAIFETLDSICSRVLKAG
ncbi:hypothetical protein Nepgr_019166 [Nepenthes gracilis]|uniref:Uncharacterized protein n=1 Tax=Nepenthes gracilis TaxID=150966 RepID=A0AAD3XUY9_NEPGR|nr:hypothetical protein Nepgr_019166 [Nepenthes gracilis]